MKDDHNDDPHHPAFPKKGYTVIILLFSARESLVSDIPAGDGKMDNPFNSVA